MIKGYWWGRHAEGRKRSSEQTGGLLNTWFLASIGRESLGPVRCVDVQRKHLLNSC